MSSPLPLDYERDSEPGSDRPALVFAARVTCAVLALAAVAALAWTIVIGSRGVSGGAYVAFLALQVATAVLLGFLAAHRPGPGHAVAFAAVALAAAAVEGVTQAALLAMTDAAPAGLTAVRLGVVALSVGAAVVFGLVRDRPATHATLLQTAHRTIALSVWLLTAKLILTLWGRPIAWVAHLLPATFALLAAAALAALTVLYSSRDDPPPAAQFAEARHLAKVSAVLLAATLLWLALATLVPTP
jgi:hypothetical protein